jgi:GNAT superfamily N-acetyltransferase
MDRDPCGAPVSLGGRIEQDVTIEPVIPMLHADLDLGRRVENGDAQGNADTVAALRRLNPESAASAVWLGGGCALYAGSESPLTQAIGIDMNGPVSAAEMDRLCDWYRGFGVPVLIEVCPLADTTLHALLRENGFKVEDHTSVLVRRITSDDLATEVSPGVEVRPARPDESDLWSMTVAEGFAGDGDVKELIELFRALSDVPDATCFLAVVDGEPVGGGAVAVSDGLAALFGTSTRHPFRSRGVQAALVRARLAFAAENGCEIGTVTTGPDTSSQRNMERQGFTVAFTRTKMRLDPTGPTA